MMSLDWSNLVQQYNALTFPDIKEGANLLIGTLVSTGVGLLIGWHFGKKGSKELSDATKRVLQETDKLLEESAKLRTEAAELRRLNILMLRGMEEAGWIKFNWGADGTAPGIVFERPVPTGRR